MELIVPELAKQYGVTEQLKAENQMEWVRQISYYIIQTAESIREVFKQRRVLSDLQRLENK